MNPVAGTCRVTVYVDGRDVDVALPGDVPVAVLVPMLVDTVGAAAPVLGLQLTLLGGQRVDPSKSLSDNGIGDGAVLMLTAGAKPRVTPAVIDAAAAAAGITRAGSAPVITARSGLGIATVMAGLTGFLAVPDGPGLPNVLLGAAAATVPAVLAMRVSADGVGTGAACLAGLGTASALVGTVGGLDVPGAGQTLAVLSLILLTAVCRLVVRWCGLAQVDGAADDLPARVTGARHLMAGLVAGAAAGAGVGVLVTAFGAASWPACAFAAAVAMVLLLRIRAHPEVLPSAALLIAGICCGVAVVVTAHRIVPAQTWLLCLLSTAVGMLAVWLGLHPPQGTFSPTAARLIRVVERAALAAAVPLACWNLGAFDAAHGLLPS
ncbi:EsaB/YukD family protein [Mycolicibacterium mengxianglii]|uniref:EsaB/YukD family protein n=1 Tax=Mycolicibacterium mengxianglii TaxID=2736649 RepID=UPI0018EF2595|nr:EsaB/YukD family protein [Mycolicibacterium mengxianglii]